MKNTIKVFRQHDNMDCGPTCLRMIAFYYGRDYSTDFLRSLTGLTKRGVTMLGLKTAANHIGLDAVGIRLSLRQVEAGTLPLPCVIHWNENHFVVLFKIKKSIAARLFHTGQKQYIIGDPGHGLVKVDSAALRAAWLGNKTQGIALTLKPNADFFEHQEEDLPQQGFSVSLFFSYLKPYRRHLSQVGLGMLLGSLLALSLPFLMQSLVDFGIKNKNVSFVMLILVAQLIMFAGSSIIDIVKSWLLLHINIRVSVTMIAEFLNKLMKLPIKFFDSKSLGDIIQRVNDHSRVESFLTGSALGTVFSLVNMFVFLFVLAIYNYNIFFIFLISSLVSVVWIVYFLSKRKDLDYMRFRYLKENQTAIREIVDGIQEIKLNNWEFEKRQNWESIQAELFKVTAKNLSLEQTQEIGANALLQLKNVIISYVSALAVIQGQLSLGQMLGISFIIGQMNAPLNQLISFIRSLQDAKISFERLTEIQTLSNEEHGQELDFHEDIAKSSSGINLENVSFRYGSPGTRSILNRLNLFIPHGKTTAIVGPSGSGKTTLLKLLLRFYEPTEGAITVDGENLVAFSAAQWRSACGTVMQDGYIFSDTILRNIVLETGLSAVDSLRLQQALKIANLQDYIDKLPLGLASHIGSSGMGLSGGQKQRILIARAAYKNPSYLFFDEATSALDANNEKVVMSNFNDLFEGKTVIVIAHRLSTVKSADQIVVMDDGKIIEVGTHISLLEQKSKYYELVKNQLHSEPEYNYQNIIRHG